jgi:murein DD-endopeptidase MepM/ murein hydrolase activator NlpD
MVPLRRAAAVAGAAAVLSAVAGQPLPARAAPTVGDEPGESSPGLAMATAPMLVGAGRSFPVRGSTSYASAHHDYPAADIFADCGTRVVAPITGTVIEVSRVDRWNPSTDRPRHRSGKFVSIVGRSDVRYYGSHMRSLAGRIQAGSMVQAGEPIGRVGKTGNAAYTSCHLHFGLSPRCHGRDDWWIRRGVVAPYRFLRSWDTGGDRDPRRAVERWLRHHGCQRSDVFG